jgi:hypothetical protein
MYTDTKTEPKKWRTGRSPAGDKAKKIVSLTIDHVLISQIDSYAMGRHQGIQNYHAWSLIPIKKSKNCPSSEW